MFQNVFDERAGVGQIDDRRLGPARQGLMKVLGPDDHDGGASGSSVEQPEAFNARVLPFLQANLRQGGAQ